MTVDAVYYKAPVTSGNVSVCSNLMLVILMCLSDSYKVQISVIQQFITQNILIATCFDPIESSSGLPKNRCNVSKFIVYSGIRNTYNG
jgi:hypothetical protein